MQLGLYQHFNGKFYQVIGIGRYEPNLEEVVIYRALYGDYALWVRPKAIFTEKVLHEGTEVPRFKFIKELDLEAVILS